MANIKDFIKKIGNEAVSLEEQQQALAEVEKTIVEAKAKREESIGKNVDLVISALKTIESKLEAKLDELNNTPAKQGIQGSQGPAGRDGRDGIDGYKGQDGRDGVDGKDGKDGEDGVSVTDAQIDFDGSLLITLSDGREIDAGTIIPLDVAKQIHSVSTNGGGTSQSVLDSLASLQAQIDALGGGSGGGISSVASADGSVTVTTTSGAVDLSVPVTGSTSNIVCQVRNTTGATLTKGTAVYISGATGQIPTVSKALATSDATSAQTLGLLTADLTNNTNGYVTVIGLITNINTSAFTDGAQLYLSSTTAGELTATKQYAPAHLVYVAVVEHAHPTQGKLFVKVQNGYEMDELHNVSAQSPSNGNTLIWNNTTQLWEAALLTAGTGISISNSAGGITVTNTSPSSGGTVTSVTGTAPIVSSGGNTPDISMAAATTSVNGYLTSTNWNTFNNKANSGTNTDITSVALTTGTVSTAPSSSTDIVNKSYADSIASGVNFHAACNYATTAALPTNTYSNGASGIGATLTAVANAALTIDGSTPAVGNRILVKNEVTQANNGVYTVTQVGSGVLPYILTRALDYDSSGSGTNEVDQGDLLLVLSGTANSNTSWVQQTPLPITIGTTAIVFIEFAKTQTYTAGTGLTLTTNQFSITDTGTAGTYGSATLIPVITTNAQGQVTGVTTASNPQGTVTSVAALTLGTTGTDVGSTVTTGTSTPVITLNIPTASASNRGALSAADWTTFNGKGSGTVTSVGGTGTVSGLTLTGTVTSSGNLTLGGTLDLSSPPTIGNTAANTGAFTSLACTSVTDTSSLARNAGKTANVSITNQATFTTGGITLPSQTAAVGSTWRIRAFGQFTSVSNATARTAQVACFWGTTQLTAITPSVLISNAQTTQWQCEFTLTASSTTAMWTAGTMIGRTASATALAIDNATAASTAVTAGAQTLDLRFRVSTAVAAESWVIQSVTMERLE
jgi:hypothetical protein